MPKIMFHGRVLPERADFNIANNPLPWTLHALGSDIECSLSIARSMVSVVCTVDDAAIDLLTLCNMVKSSAVRLITDAYGVAMGIGYDVEIISATNLETGCQRVFGVDVAIDVDAEFPELAEVVAQMGNELQLRSAIANFREAIRLPDETAFYSYRSIEAVKGYFLQRENGAKDSAAWEKTRSNLNLKATTLTEFKDVADKMRHGVVVPQTWDQRKRQMEIAREVIRRFSHFLSNGKTDLTRDQFPLY